MVAALGTGYRHPDTAQTYGNERGVGRGIRGADVDRDELLYVHRPRSAYDPEATLAALDELRAGGVTDPGCVSNCTPDLLAEARDLPDAPVAAHQVERDPLLPQEELRADARDHGCHLVGYAPFGRGGVLDAPVVTDVAEGHDTTAAAVRPAWATARGTSRSRRRAATTPARTTRRGRTRRRGPRPSRRLRPPGAVLRPRRRDAKPVRG